jgi:FkbM family methyltransferase
MSISKSELVPPIALRLKSFLSREFLRNGSTGLNRLDLKLIEVIKPGRNGYFVELGANDGIQQSNTYKLQRHFGWTGLLIEPSPKRYVECVANRAFANVPEVRCAACVPFSFNDRFVEVEDADLMSVAKGLDVPDNAVIEHANKGSKFLANNRLRHSYGALALTLTAILDEVSAPAAFNLLSLDVEGNELSVLKGLDFTKYNPKWVLVETRDSEVADYLSKFGYKLTKALSDYSAYSDLLFSLES